MVEEQEAKENYEKNDLYNHLYGEQQHNFNEINDSFKFKSELLKLSEETEGLISKDIVLANLTEKDKKKALEWLKLSADCNDFGLFESGLSFYKDVLLLSGISRGTKGFQQDKFNENRDIRVSNLQNEKKPRKFGRY